MVAYQSSFRHPVDVENKRQLVSLFTRITGIIITESHEETQGNNKIK